MNFEYTEKVQSLQEKLNAFFETYILPVEEEVAAFTFNPENRWKQWPRMEGLKEKAKTAGLWNLFLPNSYGEISPGLSNLEYAPLAEIMGRISWSSEVFNCSAPDTGNMEVLAKYGSTEQQEKWLKPLLKGYVERQVLNWGKQYLKAATRDVSAAKKGMRWMEDNQPKEYDYSLIHNDFKYDNVVFKDDSWTDIIAVLDWEMAILGDPLMDLGTALGYWTMGSDPNFVKQGISSSTLMEGNFSRSEIVEQYVLKSKRPVNHLVFYYVYGLFKIAVIPQQIFYRYSKGLTTDPRFANLDKAAELLCNLAYQAIQNKKID